MNKYNYGLVYNYIKKVESLLLFRRLELMGYLEGIDSEASMFLNDGIEVERFCSKLRKIRITVKQAHREKGKLDEKKVLGLDIFYNLYKAYYICGKIIEDLGNVIQKTNSVLTQINSTIKESNLSNIVKIEVSNIGITMRELREIESGYNDVVKELENLVHGEEG